VINKLPETKRKMNAAAMTAGLPINDVRQALAARSRMLSVAPPAKLAERRVCCLLGALWISGNALITDFRSLCRRFSAAVFLGPVHAHP
jgi:hypothetical protein